MLSSYINIKKEKMYLLEEQYLRIYFLMLNRITYLIVLVCRSNLTIRKHLFQVVIGRNIISVVTHLD